MLVANENRKRRQQQQAGATPSGSGDDDMGFDGIGAPQQQQQQQPNGEEVKNAMERFQLAQAVRATISGLGFVMSVVGIWGDGY